jgi:hypothetical protein
MSGIWVPPPEPDQAGADRRYVFAFPHPGTVTTGFAQSLLNLREPGVEGPLGIWNVRSGPNVGAALNNVAEAFMDHPEAPPFLLLADSDVAFAPDVPARLLDTGERFIEAACPEWGYAIGGRADAGRHTPVGLEDVEFADLPEVVEVDGFGGVFLLHRDVLAVTGPPWFEHRINQAGEVTDYDWALACKARDAGFPPKMATRVRVVHQKLASIFFMDDGSVTVSP